MANNQKFQETLKHLLYAGVGFAAESSKKVQKNVDELIKKGKINERDGKKIVDQVMHNTELKRKELETKLNKVVDQYGKTGLNQITSLTKKIQKLETELQKRVKSATASVGGSKPAAKAAPKAAKKATPAKKAAAAPKKVVKKKAAPVKKAVTKVAAKVEEAAKA